MGRVTFLKHIVVVWQYYALNHSGHTCTEHGLPFPTSYCLVANDHSAVLQRRLADGGVCDFGVGALQNGANLLVIEICQTLVGLNGGGANLEDAVGRGVLGHVMGSFS